MIVCVCRRVSEHDIRRAAHNGCGCLEELQWELGVATGCGRCAECAQSVLQEALARPARPRGAPGLAETLALA
jgi:bacterioferritin-associated ferredoxin